MSLKLMRGALDSYMVDECIARIEKDKTSKHIVIIPEHYSYEMERIMVDRFGVIGINNIQVLTPHRMAVKYINTDTTSYLTAAGKQMLIVRAVKKCIDDDVLGNEVKRIMKRRSFNDSMVTLITEFKRRSIFPEDIKETAAAVENERIYLADKLNAAAAVYGEYNALLGMGHYVDMEDDIFRLAQGIGSVRDAVDDNTKVWFMRFDEYLPQHISLIRALVKAAAEVTVCINYVKNLDNENGNFSEIYMPSVKSYNRLIAERAEEEEYFRYIADTAREREIEFLVRNFGALVSIKKKLSHKSILNKKIAFCKKLKIRSGAIKVIECRDPHTELEYIAESIHTLIRESSGILRYRDIGILFGNAAEYTHILDAVFSEHNIPYFADEKLILSEHPIAVQLLSVFDIYETDWGHDAIMRYLNAGFIFDSAENGLKRLDMADVSALDSYIVRYDIRGRGSWLKKNDGEYVPWTYGGEVFAAAWEDYDPDDISEVEMRERERINELRYKICPPLERLLPKGADEEKPVEEHINKIIEFLRDINIDNGLMADVRRFENNNDDPDAPQTAQQFSQIWNGILDVIEQIGVTMRGICITFGELGDYLNAGLSKCEIRTIPSALDSVYTGSVERSTSVPVKYLFVSGAVSGTYPAPEVYDGYFSDIDREIMSGSLEIALSKDEQRAVQRYRVYKAVRAAVKEICVTYPLQNQLGEECRQSGFVTDITDMFGIKKQSAFPDNPLDEENITSVYAAKKGLLINCASPINKLPPVWKSVYRYMRDSGKYNDELNQIGLAASLYSHAPSITPETADMLYTRHNELINGRVYSSTRLDSYTDCPMRYFMQFGLGLGEEERGGVQTNEVGTYIHKLLQNLCAEVEQLSETSKEAWQNMDIDSLNAMIDNIVENTKENLPKESDNYPLRVRIMDRICKSVKRGAKNVMNSLKAGRFYIKDTELRLDNVQLADEIYITGIVDRIDEYVSDSFGKFIRIIDYKTGKDDYSADKIKNGKKMQLVLYAIAAQMYYEAAEKSKIEISGIYYQHIRDKFFNDSKYETEVRDERYLNGETYLPSPKEHSQAHEELLKAIGNDPDYVNLSFNKDGSCAKKCWTSNSERDEMIQSVKKNILGIDTEIMQGTILPHPYRDGGSIACTYCSYKDICSFETEKSIRLKNKDGADFGNN